MMLRPLRPALSPRPAELARTARTALAASGLVVGLAFALGVAGAAQDPEPERAVTIGAEERREPGLRVGQEEGDPATVDEGEEPFRSRTDAVIPEPPGSGPVRATRLLISNAGRLDWALQGDWLVFDRRDADGLYDLYRATAQGAGTECLTCGLLEFENAHALNPSWHPSGQLIVFQAQPRARRLDQSSATLTTPERGLHTELWTISADGESFFQLTRSDQTGAGVLDPRFSHEGDLLAWSERVANRNGLWGDWVIRVARFGQRAGIPRLGKVRTYRPGAGRGFVVAHGFTPDDRGLILSGQLEPGQPATGLDLYLLDLESEELTRLTRTLGDYDVDAAFSPAGDWLAWASNRSVPPLLRGSGRGAARPIPRDLWMMNADGSGAERLTFFNPRASRNPDDGAVVGDFAWSPTGDRIAVHVLRDFAAPREEIYLLELDPGLGRDPVAGLGD